MKKRIIALLLALVLALLQCTAAAESGIELAAISKYGNLELEITGADFFALGYDHGDMISAGILGTAWIMPVCSSYSDVNAGDPVCRVETMDGPVILAINMGDLATSAGLARKESTDEAPGYRWDLADGVEAPVMISISMEETGSYRSEWIARQLVRTNERADYAHLDDAAFANFRMIDTPGMAAGKLFRSSSPIDPQLDRSSYALAAMEAAGVKTVINLADTHPDYPGFGDSYYAGCAYICLGLDVNPAGDAFRSGLARGLRFLLENEGPCLIHCTEGKDRAGFVSAVLECLMGADARAVVADYMETYYNYYGVQAGTEQYEAIADSNVRALLAQAFGVESIYSCDLAAEAREYLMEIGLSAAEIDNLMAKLSS